MCSDQGPDASCALNWLICNGYNICVVADPSHRIWNDYRNSAGQEGLLLHDMAVTRDAGLEGLIVTGADSVNESRRELDGVDWASRSQDLWR